MPPGLTECGARRYVCQAASVRPRQQAAAVSYDLHLIASFAKSTRDVITIR
jgi:hypothetical protein